MTILKFAAGAIVALLLAFAAFGVWVSRPAFDTQRSVDAAPTLAAPSEALTFARTDGALLRVTAHEGDALRGVDLTAVLGGERTADLLALYRVLGYDGLLAIEGETVRVPLDALRMPVDFHYPYVAVGTNYAEHADEVYLDDPPFLFPKLARASAWNAPVAWTERLDYEAELGVVPLADIHSLADIRNPEQAVPFGLVLVNDFTDRWTLIRQIDLAAPMGTTGFPDAKGRETFLPTGYLFVIPRERAWLDDLQHRLWVNDRLRQRFTAGEMILTIEDIVAQALDQADRAHQSSAGPVPLLPEGHIPRGTLILTGTAAGVIFKPANIWLQAVYLDAGDRVRTEADFLGHLDTTIR